MRSPTSFFNPNISNIYSISRVKIKCQCNRGQPHFEIYIQINTDERLKLSQSYALNCAVPCVVRISAECCTIGYRQSLPDAPFLL